MSEQLQYNYAQIEVETGRCFNVFTSSYQIPSELLEYVEIPVFDISYRDKYYNRSNGLWYYEPEFVTEFII